MRHRWNQHCAQAKRLTGKTSHFINAIRKYGKKAFEPHLLNTCSSLGEANLWEDFWIDFYNTRDLGFGFNVMRGGEHKPHGIKSNPWDRPEYRAKCAIISRLNGSNPVSKAKNSAALTGRQLSQQHRLNIASSSRNRVATSSARHNISLASTKLWQDPNFGRNRNRKAHGDMICTKHGSMIPDQCYRRVRKNGYIWFMCKRCVSDHNKRRVRVGNGVRLMRPRV